MKGIDGLFQWMNIKKALKDEYKVSREDDDNMVFTFAFEVGGIKRSQVVFVSRVETGGGTEFVQIMSRIGEIAPKRVNPALEYMHNTVCGGMVKIEEGYFVRQNLLIEGLSMDILNQMIGTIVMTADAMEMEFVGGDEN